MRTMRKYFLALVIFIAICTLFLGKFQYEGLTDVVTKTKKLHPYTNDKNCGRMPRDSDLKYDGNTWQIVTTEKQKFALLNAYFDDREGSVVRVTALGEELNTTERLHCQFWLDENPESFPFVVEASKIFQIWPENETTEERMLPFLITCPIYFNGNPVSVSLVEKKCDTAQNKLKIIDNKPPNELKKSFGVCCTTLFHEQPDFVIKFIEWMEILKILGAEKVTTFNTSSDHFKIINHYMKKGFLDMTNWTDPTSLRLKPQNNILELLQLTDCFYRTRNLYEYLVVVKSDEVLMPMKPEHKTWHDITKDFRKTDKISSYMSLNMIFPQSGKPGNSEVASYLYMLQHTERFNETNGLVKSIIDPTYVLSLYEHFAHLCLGEDWCNFDTLDPSVSAVFHYKTSEINNATMSDSTIFKYKDELVAAVNLTMSETGFVP